MRPWFDRTRAGRNASRWFARLHSADVGRPTDEAFRRWLERNPEKVLYGTDAYPFSDLMGWEESLWMANKTARAALALALESMQRDHEITREQALHLAQMVPC